MCISLLFELASLRSILRILLAFVVKVLRHLVQGDGEPFVFVRDVVLLHQGFNVRGDRPEVVSRHARVHMVLIVEVQTAEEPVKPARSLVVDVDFDLARREAHVLLVLYLAPRLPVVIPN